ncbi:MAG TPA: glycosidase [Bacteroidales bacterium]|jgi:beta-1,2-mannosidase|nr:glycosidase [Bacteroidales bacterium]HBZ20994.1 glycosidase [Bacteroidales bacterium]
MKTKLFFIGVIILSACYNNVPDEKTNPDASKGWALIGFVKADSINPILKPSPDQLFFCPLNNKEIKWEERNVLNPSAVVKDDKVYMIYRAQDNQMTSRLGLAVSSDGLHFTKQPNPVFFPDSDSMQLYEWKGGVEDPRIVEGENGIYILTYTSYDGKTARLCLATSPDLRSWTKHGLVLGEGKYKETWSKSGAIVSKLAGDRIIAARIGGKYWMYFGDTDLFMATSEDLIHWTVVENDENKKMISVLQPRPGYFDSRLVEPGPFALISDQGILLIYNSSNALSNNDPGLPSFTYSAGQALFDKKYPYKLIDRLDKYFIYPDKTYEKTGEVNNVCFVEGLVFFRKKWFLYYGTADSKIAVAVKE